MAKDTREIITSAFLKLARQNPSATSFNMTEIASEAKSSRQAIYQKHFSKVEEIIDYIHKKTDDQIFNAYSEYSTEKDHCPFEFLADKIFPIIYENRLTIGTLYMTKADPTWHDFLCENYSKWAIKNLKFDKFNLNDKMLSRVTACMTIAIIEMWITQENPIPPKEFKKTFLEMVSTPLRNYVVSEQDNTC